jgi:hypothetical protein
MARFVIQSTHTPEECLATLDALMAQGRDFLSQYDFGCAVGDHSNHVSYATVEARDAADARRSIPAPLAARAQVVEVGKFTEEQVRSFHRS